jgi:hypothetical protein
VLLQKYMIILPLTLGIISLLGCEGTTQKSYYYSEYESYTDPQSNEPRVDFYDPTGDPANTYDPVYSPIQRPPTYTPGTPAYEYRYYYSENQGD